MKPTVLIVDDSSFSRRLTRAMLEEMGCTVHEAVNGQEAIARCAIDVPALVLLDLVLGATGLQGEEVLAELRRAQPSLPVVVLTADVQQATETEMRRLGAVAYLHKPVSRVALTAMIETLQGAHA